MQDALESALSRIAGHEVATICAGRTDAGAHALAQVVHFDSDAIRPLNAWVRGVNALLPDAVAVTWAQPVASAFHARFDAVERSYRYLLCNRDVRPALECRRAGWYHRALDVARMRDAATALIGEHDFSAFRAAECQARTPVRQLRRVAIERRGDYVLFDFSANAFLQHMVRNMVSCLVYVGCGKRSPQWLSEILQSRDRRNAAPTFDAAGLYLSEVGYAAHWGLPMAVERDLVVAVGGVGKRA